MTGIDLAPGLIELAKRLSDLSGIPVDFAVADALKLPFADTRFDVVNAAPNIKDKPRLYVQMRRVLRPGGRMAMHDLVQGPNPGPLHMPVPEADNEDERSLASSSFAIWARRCDAA